MANARGHAARRDRVRARSALPTPGAAPDASSASMSSLESLDAASRARHDLQASANNGQKARVLLSNDELVARAREAAAGIDFPALTSAGALRSSWKHKTRAGVFTTYSREFSSRESAGNNRIDDGMDDHPLGGRSRRRRSAPSAQVFEVLAVGELACGLEELAHALRAASDVPFNTVMSGVHRKDFIYGSVVHVVPVAEEGEQGGGRVGGGDANKQRLESLASVKTSTFVRSSMFGQNEQWCFLELFRRSRFSRSFFVTTSSLPARVLSVGKAQHGRVDHLHGLTTGYWVEELPSTGKGAVRVVFFGQFVPNTVLHEEELGDGGAYAAASTAKKRLLRIARATGQLEDVVRRRRLGAQTLADRAAFDPKNSRCICCTKSLGLLSTKKRCYLCGYAVCDNCWSIQNMETRAGQVSTLRVCSRCLELVDAGDYSHVTPESLGPVQIVPDKESDKKKDDAAPSRELAATTCSTTSAALDEHGKEPLSSSQSSSRASSKASAPARKNTVARPPSSSSTRKASMDTGAVPTRKATLDVDAVPVMLSDLLQDALKDEYYATRKQSVMTVMQQLLDEERADTNTRAKAYSVAPTASNLKSRPKSALSSPPPSMASSSASTSSTASARRTTTPDEMMASLEEAIRGKSLPLEDCVHATSSATGGGRKYALAPKEAPVPANEAQRLEAIERGNLMQLGDSEKLDALCKLAAREMGCSTSVLTIVGQQEQRVLASNVSEMKRSQLPRNETFCQHTVMGDAPLLVPHPEADVRFQSIAARTQGGRDYRFYCGFPIRGDNDAVVGAICVLDERSHDVTQAQFSAMQRLAQTASDLVQQVPTADR